MHFDLFLLFSLPRSVFDSSRNAQCVTETAAREAIFFRSFVLTYSKLGLTFQRLLVQASPSSKTINASTSLPGFFLEIGEALGTRLNLRFILLRFYLCKKQMNIPPHRQLLTAEFLISRYMCNQMVMRIKSIFRSIKF